MSTGRGMNAIEIEGLSKVYRLYPSPLHRLKELVLRRKFHSDFVALDNVTLTVGKGETFGIIGENGAGKSTLLKTVAGTLKPTAGSVSTRGRVAALLELGAGFNYELTGEENIFLNAYLMGLTKAEIEAKKQAILDFAELGGFVRRPLKTYSSGMVVRLAFSIATSVDPEVLIVDEALSVGDEYFQKKSVDRMMEFRKAGKTILFCSHSMYYVQELCQRALWLHQGRIRYVGDAGAAVSQYQNYERERQALLKSSAPAGSPEEGQNTGSAVRITGITVRDKLGSPAEIMNPLDPMSISVRVACGQEGLRGHIGIALIRNDEVMCFGTTTEFDGLDPVEYVDGTEYTMVIPRNPLLAGSYRVMAIVADDHGVHPYDTVHSRPFMVSGKYREFGLTFVDHEWKV